MNKRNNIISKIISFVLVAFLAFTVYGCQNKSSISVTLETNKNVLSYGDSLPLKVTIAGSTEGVSFEVSDSNAIEVKYDENIMNYLVVAKKIVATDTKVVVTAVSKENSGVKASKELTIKAPTLAITADKSQAVKGDTVNLTPTFTGFGTSRPEITYKANSELVRFDGDVLTVLEKSSEEKVVVITGTATLDGVSVSNTCEITLNAQTSVKVEFTIENGAMTISDEEPLQLFIKVTGTENTNYDYKIVSQGDPNVVAIDKDNVLKVVKSVGVETLVTIKVFSTEDPSVSVSRTLTVLPSTNVGSVGELTSEMLEVFGNKSITVEGVLTDYYRDYNQTYNSTTRYYDMKVEMEEGAWKGSWYRKGYEDEIISNLYRTSDQVGIDQNGFKGHILTEVYINKDNKVMQAPVIDYVSVPAVWEAQHLWNHLSNLQINKFVHDLDNDVYRYDYDPTSMDDLYLMTYLSICFTPLLEDTINELYLYVEDGKITKLYGETEHLLYGTEDEPSAMSYSSVELTLTNIGTTVVEDPLPYEAPENSDILVKALAQMNQARNYTFRSIDTTTYAPVTDGSEYDVSYESIPTNKSKLIKEAIGNNTSENGNVGLYGQVTEDAILLAETIKYSYSLDGKNYSTSYSGLKQVSEDIYDEFAFNSKTGTLYGTRQHKGNIFDDMPTFEFSPNIFEYTGSKVSGHTKNHTFRLIEKRVTRDVALEVSSYKYAKDAQAGNTHFEIVVNEEGYVVSTTYPYSIVSGTYIGYVTTTYSKVGTTVLEEGLFDGYVPRKVKTSWSEYLMEDYSPRHTTKEYVPTTADAVFEAIFGDAAKDIPSPSVLMEVFGDFIHGPFFNWRNVDDDNYIDYVSFNSQSQEYDINMQITNYEEIIAELTEALGSVGFSISESNTDTTGGPTGRSDRYVTFYKNDIIIVVQNNHTRFLFCYIYKAGDWTLH